LTYDHLITCIKQYTVDIRKPQATPDTPQPTHSREGNQKRVQLSMCFALWQCH